MPVQSVPKLGASPPPAPLRKIALEEHFGHPIVFMRDSKGRFETRKEADVGHLGYPYEDYAEGGEFIDTVPISESDRRKIAYENAKALYKL